MVQGGDGRSKRNEGTTYAVSSGWLTGSCLFILPRLVRQEVDVGLSEGVVRDTEIGPEEMSLGRDCDRRRLPLSWRTIYFLQPTYSPTRRPK